MAVKRYENGAWVDASSLRRFENGAWKDVGFGRRYENGAWVDVWPTDIQVGQVLTDYVYTPLSNSYNMGRTSSYTYEGYSDDPIRHFPTDIDPAYNSSYQDYKFWDCGHFNTKITPGTYCITIDYYEWYKCSYNDTEYDLAFCVYVLKEGESIKRYTKLLEAIRMGKDLTQDLQYGNVYGQNRSYNFSVDSNCHIYIRAIPVNDKICWANGYGYYTVGCKVKSLQRIA